MAGIPVTTSDADRDSGTVETTKVEDRAIRKFLDSYEQDWTASYAKVTRRAISLLSKELKDDAKIKHEIYNRGDAGAEGGDAKDPKSAERTINRRRKERKERKQQPYKTKADIVADMHDLAGFRIALYYPNDFQEVESRIQKLFDEAKPPQDWPDGDFGPHRYKLLDSGNRDISGRASRFPGYLARHYRVRFKEDSNLDPALKGKVLEIQLMSLIMHAWSTMHHELIYKARPELPEPDEDDERLIDISNGLIVSGEQVLRQIQINLNKRRERARSAFRNEHDFWSHIDEKWIKDMDKQLGGQRWIQDQGNEDKEMQHLLYQSMAALKMNNSESVDDLFKKAIFSHVETRSRYVVLSDKNITLVALLFITLADYPNALQSELQLLNVPSGLTTLRSTVQGLDFPDKVRLVRYYVLIICNTVRWYRHLSGAHFMPRLKNLLGRHIPSGEEYPSRESFLRALHPRRNPWHQDAKDVDKIQKFFEYTLLVNDLNWKIGLALSSLGCFYIPTENGFRQNADDDSKYQLHEYTICPEAFLEVLDDGIAGRIKQRSRDAGPVAPWHAPSPKLKSHSDHRLRGYNNAVYRAGTHGADEYWAPKNAENNGDPSWYKLIVTAKFYPLHIGFDGVKSYINNLSSTSAT